MIINIGIHIGIPIGIPMETLASATNEIMLDSTICR